MIALQDWCSTEEYVWIEIYVVLYFTEFVVVIFIPTSVEIRKVEICWRFPLRRLMPQAARNITEFRIIRPTA